MLAPGRNNFFFFPTKLMQDFRTYIPRYWLRGYFKKFRHSHSNFCALWATRYRWIARCRRFLARGGVQEGGTTIFPATWSRTVERRRAALRSTQEYFLFLHVFESMQRGDHWVYTRKQSGTLWLHSDQFLRMTIFQCTGDVWDARADSDVHSSSCWLVCSARHIFWNKRTEKHSGGTAEGNHMSINTYFC